jgi:hypothetical protein
VPSSVDRGTACRHQAVRVPGRRHPACADPSTGGAESSARSGAVLPKPDERARRFKQPLGLEAGVGQRRLVGHLGGLERRRPNSARSSPPRHRSGGTRGDTPAVSRPTTRASNSRPEESLRTKAHAGDHRVSASHLWPLYDSGNASKIFIVSPGLLIVWWDRRNADHRVPRVMTDSKVSRKRFTSTSLAVVTRGRPRHGAISN